MKSIKAYNHQKTLLLFSMAGFEDPMMVAGADMLCAYMAEKEDHPTRAIVDVTINDNLLDDREPDIVMERFRKGYGADYKIYLPSREHPTVFYNGRDVKIVTAWLCPMTLHVLFQYPQIINIYILKNA